MIWYDIISPQKTLHIYILWLYWGWWGFNGGLYQMGYELVSGFTIENRHFSCIFTINNRICGKEIRHYVFVREWGMLQIHLSSYSIFPIGMCLSILGHAPFPNKPTNCNTARMDIHFGKSKMAGCKIPIVSRNMIYKWGILLCQT